MSLHEAIAARNAFLSRFGSDPRIREVGVGPSRLNGRYCVQVSLARPAPELPSRVRGVEVDHDPRPAERGEGIPRWAWSGRADVFDVLDENRDGVVDADELARAIGDHGRSNPAFEPLPVARRAWTGSPTLFDALDVNRDGALDEQELRDGLGPHAQRLVRGEPLSGPTLPGGAVVGWKGSARWISFKGREDKARYMSDAARHDAGDPAIRWWVEAFHALPRPERERAILRFCQLCMRYERDPAWLDDLGARHGIELLDSSSVGLQRGYGDCDLKARVFVALCLASGVPAHIEPVFRGDSGFPHVRARVLRRDQSGWETADPTIVNSTIGRLPRKPLTALSPT